MNNSRFTRAMLVLALVAVFWLAVKDGAAQAPQPGQPLAPDDGQVLTALAFTYQGQLKFNDAPYTGVCDFQFSLWDAVTAGVKIQGPVDVTNVSVSAGLFTAQVPLSNFQGDKRFLESAVRCPAGSGEYTTLAPRTEITPTPFAMGLVPGAEIRSNAADTQQENHSLFVANSIQASGFGNPVAIRAVSDSANSTGISYPFTLGPVAIAGSSNAGVGIFGSSSAATGHAGYFAGSSDDFTKAGVKITNSLKSVGLWSVTQGANAGVFGQGAASGVVGEVTSNGGVGVQGRLGAGVSSGWAGQFLGNVDVTGTIFGPILAVRIDHPLNPGGQFLNQAAIVSPEQLNVYSGNVTTGEDGFATVQLPAYASALSGEFRYQLTVIGQFAQAIVAKKIEAGQFVIQTDRPNVEVSWQVSGVRQDPTSRANPLVVEQAKSPAEQGLYYAPASYGAASSQSLESWYRRAAIAEEAPGAVEVLP